MTDPKRQVFVIHGGNVFDTYEAYLADLRVTEIDLERLSAKGWKDSLAAELGEGFEVIAPRMPNPSNAKYLEWQIWFEKFVPHMQGGVILVGHSLGGVFLAKYLSEHELPHKIAAVMLVAAPFDAGDDPEHPDSKLPEFALSGELGLLASLSNQTPIFLYHSEDDPVVPFTELAKYRRALPRATPRIFPDRQHFNQPNFSELVQDIKSL